MVFMIDLVNGTSYNIDDEVEVIDLSCGRRSKRVCKPVHILTYTERFQQVVRPRPDLFVPNAVS